MTITEKLNNGRLYLDGGMGTLLIEKGLKPGELPETWNLMHPDIICDIHKQYLDAGADIILTNTFGATSLKFSNVADIVTSGVNIAKRAVLETGKNKFVAYDVGPLGKLLKPYGELEFEKAVELFSEGMAAAESAGADLIVIETISDSYETKAAVLAAKENTLLPVFVTNAYDASHKLMTGATPETMVAILEGLRVDALGINCSLGPEQMLPVIKELLKYSSIPVIVSPNAGLPAVINGKSVYDVDADKFSDIMAEIADLGVSVLGGCCGTTPEYIAKTVQKTAKVAYNAPKQKNYTVVSSYTHGVYLGDDPVIIGERINPTGKSRFKEALRSKNIDYILKEGIAEEEHGAQILDVNVGLPEIDETEMMSTVIKSLQGVTALPLQIDTVDPKTLEKALRLYNGKAMINSVNGKEDSMKSVFPLAAKYGGVIIALTLDENGIPDSAQKRLKIAEKIVSEAAKYGIEKKDIIADPLAMAVSADPQSANITLETVRLIRKNLGIGCCLGVSNISFGLPKRDFINSTFFSMALLNGLSCGIVNPLSPEMMKSIYSYRVLTGRDKMCKDYIDFASATDENISDVSSASIGAQSESGLKRDIEKGLCKVAVADSLKLLETENPLEIINKFIIPALDSVGKGFENKTIYLPQLLMSAEAAKSAFEVIKKKLPAIGGSNERKVVLATVKGDIHDIGKNIVKVLLENYGFNVIDLGKDVPPESVLDAVKSSGAKLVGLSALMTTTVPSMEETVRLIKGKYPNVSTVVGGAVLTAEYAAMIGADYYSADAMQTVRYAEKVYSGS